MIVTWRVDHRRRSILLNAELIVLSAWLRREAHHVLSRQIGNQR
jgi:hypothetical protein